MLHLKVSIICLKLTLVNIHTHFLLLGKSAHRSLLHVLVLGLCLVQSLNSQVTAASCVGGSLQAVWLPRGVRELNAFRELARQWPDRSGFSLALVTQVPSVSPMSPSMLCPSLCTSPQRLSHGSMLGQLSKKSRENKILVLKDVSRDQPRLRYSLPA